MGPIGMEPDAVHSHPALRAMQTERTCPECGKRYWPKQAWIHAKCAINTPPAINKESVDAINTRPTGGDGRVGGVVQSVSASDEGQSGAVDGSGSDGGDRPDVGADRSPNRRARSVYNEYMRGYMKRKRAK